MRDIRNDLHERLAALQSQQYEEISSYHEKFDLLQSEHRRVIAAIESERAAIKQLLLIEERRALAAPAIQSDTSPLVPLSDFIIAKIQTTGPLEREELRSAAEEAGYKDGRTFHTTLMNITKGRRLQQMADGRYAIPSLDDEPFFQLDRKDHAMRFVN